MSATLNDPSLASPPALSSPPQLDHSEKRAVFLDFDGTLVEIAPRPDAVEVARGLPELLYKLARLLEGRLAIVSGRSLADLDRHLGPLPVAMAGSHGGEMRDAGRAAVQSLAAPLPLPVAEAVRAVAADHGGLLVEAKPSSIAIHYRDRPRAEADVQARTGAIAATHGLATKHGKMVSELVMPGADKGSAINRFMMLAPFSGTRPIFVGDDVTDEDAFRAVLQYDGGGILVGPERETAALWRIGSVAHVHAWLRAAFG